MDSQITTVPIQGGLRAMWRGFHRDVGPGFTPVMEYEEARRLMMAMGMLGAEGLPGDVAAFDVAAWIASGRAPEVPPSRGKMH